MATLNHPEKEKPRKPYEKPVARKILPEEAKRKLIEDARQGNQDAKEFLEMHRPMRQRNYQRVQRSR